jgi:hypothetical protein
VVVVLLDDSQAFANRSQPNEEARSMSPGIVVGGQAPHYLGFLAAFAHLDNPATNAKTREVLGWEPTHAGWIEDVQNGHYIT